MRFHHVCIESTAYALPEEILTSEALERRLAPVYDRLNLHIGRLELMSGIRARRLWPPGTMPSTVGARAGQAALQAAGLAPADVDFLIHAAVSRDYLEPATAAVVHHDLQLPPAAGFFDISNACLGFLNAMVTIGNMIELGQIRRGLIVAGECSRQLLETTVQELTADPHTDRPALKRAFASLTIGSGAAAMVLAHEHEARQRHRLLGGILQTDTRHHGLCQGSADTGFRADAGMLMNTDSEALLETGCALAARTWPRFLESLSWSADSVDRCCTHQVGVAHRDRLYEALGRDPELDFATLQDLGNVGSVSLPATLALGIERDPPQPGERLALLGIGSGLSCMMLGIEWQDRGRSPVTR
jgi:3-oxoacyl-[acyl-carrier-protein] synthase-3